MQNPRRKALGTIVSHCRTCFPNLRVAASSSTLKYRQKNVEQTRKVSLKSYHLVKEKESSSKQDGIEPDFSCQFCQKTFFTESAKLLCERRCKSLASSSTSHFINQNLDTISPSVPDSQQSNESDGVKSSVETGFMKAMEIQNSNSLQYRKFTVYFVVLADPAIEKIGLLEHIRQNSSNTSCAMEFYVGKNSSQLNQHDIMYDHSTRRRSAIIESMRSGILAYEVKRLHFDTKEEMEAEEAFWTLYGSYRKLVKDSVNKMQWRMVNSRLENGAACGLSDAEKHDAVRLAERNHPLICAQIGCEKDHNVFKRSHFAMFHVIDDDIKLLDFKNTEHSPDSE